MAAFEAAENVAPVKGAPVVNKATVFEAAVEATTVAPVKDAPVVNRPRSLRQQSRPQPSHQ